jgi:hypothetical protein
LLQNARKIFKRKNSGANEQVAASAENAKTFYTAFSSPSTNFYHFDTVPSAILDTGAVGSIIGKVVLERLMDQLALTTGRTVDNSSHRVHKFGTNGEPLKRLFSCELSWNAVQSNREYFSFKIVVDVLPGEHLLLLGFLKLKR